jgi:hypothetical protein
MAKRKYMLDKPTRDALSSLFCGNDLPSGKVPLYTEVLLRGLDSSIKWSKEGQPKEDMIYKYGIVVEFLSTLQYYFQECRRRSLSTTLPRRHDWNTVIGRQLYHEIKKEITEIYPKAGSDWKTKEYKAILGITGRVMYQEKGSTYRRYVMELPYISHETMCRLALAARNVRSSMRLSVIPYTHAPGTTVGVSFTHYYGQQKGTPKPVKKKEPKLPPGLPKKRKAGIKAGWQ